MKEIKIFDGEFAFLSNFYPSPITISGIEYPTVEHAFQAMKTIDVEMRKKIAAADTPGKAKRLGRRVELRADWEEVKESIMMLALEAKFNIPELREKLLATGYAYLEEGTTWHDNEWGNCSCEQCRDIVGKNKLGHLLMQLRGDLQGRTMKWHIYSPLGVPLCWEDKCLEFDTEAQAIRFRASVMAQIWPDPTDDIAYSNIKETIQFYDYGYINASNYIAKTDDVSSENYLFDVVTQTRVQL